MSILYLGMMSMITPPVAIGAFFAASLAKAEPMRTGFTAIRFGWTAYVVPFLFIFSPTLLLQSPSVTETVIAVFTAVVGVFLVTVGITGFLFRLIPWWGRVVFAIAGLCLLIPAKIGAWAVWTASFGAILGVLFLGNEFFSHRRKKRRRDL